MSFAALYKRLEKMIGASLPDESITINENDIVLLLEKNQSREKACRLECVLDIYIFLLIPVAPLSF